MKKRVPLAIALSVAASIAVFGTTLTPISAAEGTTGPTETTVAALDSSEVPSQANPFITLEFNLTYAGERWITVEWGCPATDSGDFVLLHRDFNDEVVGSIITSNIAPRWQRAIGEIWFYGYPNAIVAGPDYLDVHMSDGLNDEEMEAAAVWINGILWFHDACGQRPHKGGPDTTTA